MTSKINNSCRFLRRRHVQLASQRLISSLVMGSLLLFASGCASYSRINNVPLPENKPVSTNPGKAGIPTKSKDLGEVMLLLSFSGGGSRAAALSYGVLTELRDADIRTRGKKQRLLDEIDIISSVSGGSFTAAYYGLFGEQIFEDYEQIFLKNDIQQSLLGGLANPFSWPKLATKEYNRSTMAVEYYEKHIFKNKTFADLYAVDGPVIQINATDLATGRPFAFRQDDFDLICSDLSKFGVARAVTASSAVPVAFNPIGLKNYSGCEEEMEKREAALSLLAVKNLLTKSDLEARRTYLDKNRRKYIHLVDGGISDNLGIRAVSSRVQSLGGGELAFTRAGLNVPRHIVVVVVNAQTSPTVQFEASENEPGIFETLKFASSAPMQRYNLDTIALVRQSLKKVSADMARRGRRVNTYFIDVSFDQVDNPVLQGYLNNISTSLQLPADQVDALRDEGKRLLRESPEYQRLLRNLR